MGVPDTRGVPDPPQEAIDAGAVSLARAVAFIDGDAEDFTVEAMRPLAEDWKWHVSRVLYELRESGAIRYASEVQALEERLEEAMSLLREAEQWTSAFDRHTEPERYVVEFDDFQSRRRAFLARSREVSE